MVFCFRKKKAVLWGLEILFLSLSGHNFYLAGYGLLRGHNFYLVGYGVLRGKFLSAYVPP